ncbi:MAG: hypothetical protein GWP91_04415 [Rhodobacterales bacterium]|nr:hypothetical protein [Rhodobacterales bacterium]
MQPQERIEEGPPPVAIVWREVSLAPRQEEVNFEASWRLIAGEPRWVAFRLAGAGVQLTQATLNGAPLLVEEREGGPWMVGWIDGPMEIVVRGVAAGDARQGPVLLDLMEAAAGTVEVDWDKPAEVLGSGAVVSVGEQFWTGAKGLSIGVGSSTSQGNRGTLVVADVGLGLTVGEGAWSASARLRWEVRQGEVSEVAFEIEGSAADLEVTGPSVAAWKRTGNRVVVTLLEPETRLVRLAAHWSGTVPKGEEASLEVPTIRPEAFRVSSSLQLARDGDLEVIPALVGWQSISHQALPEWGKDLTLGAPTASYTTSKASSGSVTLIRFTPVAGPPTFVDVATITAAATADGRVLMRAHYAVRNDRAAHLRITPPAGAKVVGARVAGQTASVGIDGDTWLIPLEKSVETVEGLLSFPVEVTLLLDETSWTRREERSIAVPQVNAPVAVMRATLHLPPGFESQLADGAGDSVDAFSEGEGLSYGAGTGQSAAAEVAMQNAVSAWMSNDFDAAQGYLEDLEDLDAFDANAQRLQSNLSVINGEQAGQFDVAMERRVKEQAKARAFKDVAKQEEVLEEAEAASLSGDYAAAELAYREALDLGGKLDKLEQSESVEVSSSNMIIEEKAKEAKKSESASKKSAASEKAARNRKFSYKFSDEDVEEDESEVILSFADDNLGGLGAVGTGKGGGGGGNFGRGVSEPAAASPVDERSRVVDTPNPTSGTILSKDVLSRIPGGKSYQSAVSMAEGNTGGSNGDALSPPPPPMAPEPEPASKPSPAPTRVGRRSGRSDNTRGEHDKVPAEFEDDDKPAVRAVALSVVIPNQGEAVRFEHMLLPENATYSIDIDAKSKRRDP